MLEHARSHHDRDGEESAIENLALHYGFTGDPETGIGLLKPTLPQIAAGDENTIGRFQGNPAALTQLAGR